jgi:hypothetical protein
MKLTDLFETEPCSRCGGTGQHSYCQMYGTTCFKCQGSGKQWTRKDKPLAMAVQSARSEAESIHGTRAQVGDLVSLPDDDGQRFWRKLTGVEQIPGTAEANCGWSATGVEGQPGYQKRYTGWVVYSYNVEGEPRSLRTSACMSYKRAYSVDTLLTILDRRGADDQQPKAAQRAYRKAAERIRAWQVAQAAAKSE